LAYRLFRSSREKTIFYKFVAFLSRRVVLFGVVGFGFLVFWFKDIYQGTLFFFPFFPPDTPDE